jgi:hypothetical protein
MLKALLFWGNIYFNVISKQRKTDRGRESNPWPDSAAIADKPISGENGEEVISRAELYLTIYYKQ